MPYVKTLRGSMPWPVNEHGRLDPGKEEAPRQEVDYTCPDGHTRTIPFDAAAVPPDAWDCRRCGRVAVRDGAPDGAQPEFGGYVNGSGGGPRNQGDTSPMAQLRKRRSKTAGEKLLRERLEQVRQSGVAR